MIASVLLALLVGTLTRLFADDLKAWRPRWTKRLITRAILRLPRDQRRRFRKKSHIQVNKTPGDIGKLIIAMRSLPASGRMARDIEHHAAWVNSFIKGSEKLTKLWAAAEQVMLGPSMRLPKRFITTAITTLSVKKDGHAPFVKLKSGTFQPRRRDYGEHKTRLSIFLSNTALTVLGTRTSASGGGGPQRRRRALPP
jgi:hypothetical protein